MQAFKFFSAIALAATAAAHVSIRSPCVRYTPYGDNCPALPSGQSLDYNINAPIGTHDQIDLPLCRYTTPYATPAATWTAGSTVDIEFREHAAVHGGGHCQFALSYDAGKTFVVIHDELRYCFTGGPSTSNTASQLKYSIKLPADLPASDKVVFAWFYNNNQGNREAYSNSADVAIVGGTSTSFTGPELLIANYGPDSPFIPEFNGNYETGIDLFNARKNITVTASGAGAGAAAGASAGNSSSGAGGNSSNASSAPAAPPSSGAGYSAGGDSSVIPSAPGAPSSTAPAYGAPTPAVPEAPVASAPAGSNAGGYAGSSTPEVPVPSAPSGPEAGGNASAPAVPEAPVPSAPAGPEAGGYAASPAPGVPVPSAPAGPEAGGYAASEAPVYRARVASIPPAPVPKKCT
ncbi:hypothetical protein IWW50_002000 [Coemansia erecta]|nr:hypothetical protein GGF43_002955 [Coemansia sp. RSA 2618]KAJ2827213.1 hypothetical protein IWW50_002000 [Coemansia erecta]